ncbi:MAG TPA: DUF1592 domain-containing protein, partial [Bryobacteraceae bacterium]
TSQISAVAAAPTFFTDSVQPFLQKNCSLCHNAKVSSGGLNMQTLAEFDSVTQKREMWELILKRLSAGEMPPKGMPRPPESDVKSITGWLQTEFDRQDRLLKPEAGHVTAHRLNRAEYNNTIRDLLGVDFHPADNFPQDDSGYGFDNIGDVLSLSPVLMEKYFSAAEKIAQTAVLGPAAVKPYVVRIQPPRAKVPKLVTAPAEYDRSGLDVPNSLHATVRFPADGEYEIRIFCDGYRPGGSEPMEEAFWLDGKQIQTFTVSSDENGPSMFVGNQDLSGMMRKVRMRIPAGDHWIAAVIPNLFEGLPASAGGTNPSKRPPPPPPDFSKFLKMPADVTPEQIAARQKRIASLRSQRTQINAATIEHVEILGPYNSVTTPSPETLKKIYVCGHLDGHHQPSCARKIVANLADRAFRRPVTNAEIAPYLQLISTAQKSGESFEKSLSVALEAILVSPDFLFRIEQVPERKLAEGVPINQYELASRLSYFLWSSMPDNELFQRAKQGTLNKPEVLETEVRRMLKDKKSEALAQNFGGQWLQFRALESWQPDHEKFPEFDDYLRMSMQQESELFIDDIVSEDKSILDFIDGKYTFLNQRLAEFYGIPDVKGPEFRKVDLTGNTQRSGIFTQASVLTVSSYATRTSPVLRGKWVLENVLNAPPPPPPPDVPNLDVAGVGTSVSLRQQLEKHRENPVCASCHSRMDPLGFALENYDAIGKWRTVDGKFPIDASGTLPDKRTFQGAAGLKSVLLSDRDVFARCVTEKLLSYALGRGLERYDQPTVKSIVNGIAAKDYRFSELVLEIVKSLPFQVQERDRPQNDRHS